MFILSLPAKDIEEYKEQLELITKLVGMCSKATAKVLLNKAETTSNVYEFYNHLYSEAKAAGIELSEPNIHVGIIRDDQ